jgi:hypothetical protein
MTKARDLANGASALSAVSATELGYLDGVTSAVQTQIDGKQAVNANVSTTELGYLDGVTSSIQTQLNAKQAVVSGVDDTEIGYLNGVTSAIQTQLNQKSEYVAGKNKIINGDFGIWQRGTSFSSATGLGYTADRWFLSWSGTTTIAVSRQTFTPGTAPVAGYESSHFARIARTAGSADDYFLQRIEDCRTFAGQTITVSFWAKANAATTISQVYAAPNAGSGGSGAPSGGGSFSGIAVTTSWARYSTTFTLNSLTGTTIGTGSYVEIVFKLGSAMGNVTLDLWGVQCEAGSVATPFQTATGTIQGELAACQRYFQKSYDQSVTPGTGSDNGAIFGCRPNGGAYLQGIHKVTMRGVPTIVAYSPTTGTSGKVRNYSSAADENASTGFIGEYGVKFAGTTGSNDLMGVHYTASAEL